MLCHFLLAEIAKLDWDLFCFNGLCAFQLTTFSPSSSINSPTLSPGSRCSLSLSLHYCVLHTKEGILDFVVFMSLASIGSWKIEWKTSHVFEDSREVRSFLCGLWPYFPDFAFPALHLKVAICVWKVWERRNTGEVPPECPDSTTPRVHSRHAAGAPGGQPGQRAISLALCCMLNMVQFTAVMWLTQRDIVRSDQKDLSTCRSCNWMRLPLLSHPPSPYLHLRGYVWDCWSVSEAFFPLLIMMWNPTVGS